MTGRQRYMTVLRGEAPDSIPLVPISMQVASEHIGVPYLEYATDYRSLVKGQLAFAETYDVDHVSAISDPATEAADCGAEVIYKEDSPPAMDEANALLADKDVLAKLTPPDPAQGRRMSNRLEVVRNLKEQVGTEKIVEGWVEGPVAEAADLRGINRLMMDFFDDPDFVHDLFEFVFEMEMSYARAQLEAGADVIGIGDAACSLVGPRIYEDFALDFHKRYAATLHEMGAKARLHICGDTRAIVPRFAELGMDIIDLDSMVPVADARTATGPKQILTGNINPVAVLRDETPDGVTRMIGECFEAANRNSYMVAAGCEIPRGTPAENLHALRDFARSHAFA